jgi:diguanylate cyclase (GGDEF)-like protein/PAS domain S-box-containing protein
MCNPRFPFPGNGGFHATPGMHPRPWLFGQSGVEYLHHAESCTGKNIRKGAFAVSVKSEHIKINAADLEDQFNRVAGENKRLQIQFSSAAKQVHELNEFIQIMLNLSPFGICIIQKHKLIYTNKAFTETFGFSPKQLRDMSPLDIVYAEDREHARKSVEAMLKGETQSFFMFRVMTCQDKIKWIMGSVALIHMNEKRAVLGNFVDLTEGRVIQLAYNDPLTGLANRMLMMDRLEQAIVTAKRRSGQLALLFLDLDEFKDVNDVHGHLVGDALLVEIANRLKEVIRRENDTIARIGGDEFLILLTDVSQRDHIENIVGNLFERFQEPVLLGNPPLRIKVNFSIGIALFPQNGEDSDTLIRNADMAMYRIKRAQGKNHFCFF